MDLEQKKLLRQLPAVDEILQHQTINELFLGYSRPVILETIRDVLVGVRATILSGANIAIDTGKLINEIVYKINLAVRPNLRPVINATGVVLHTNLGRALLPASACRAVQKISAGYCNLEIDLTTGKRGSRYSAVEELLIKLTGAEAALVVNNNAAAVLLTLATIAKGKEVIVSRGQLVEIGGSFRIPEVMAQSGAKLVEVGATNKTYPQDYEKAITTETGLLLHVHTSNFCIIGFTQETTVAELAYLGKQHNLPVISDLGSGFLVDLAPFGLPPEPTVQQTVKAGADVVTFSGDKLLGGPQAGIIAGQKHYIEQIKKNPLTRAVRMDKFTVAALEATLREYLNPAKALQNVPTLRMLTESVENLHRRARELAVIIAEKIANQAEVTFIEGLSQVGGGAMPTANLPTGLVAIRPDNIAVDCLVARLRNAELPVVGRVQNNRLLLDIRTIQQEDIQPILTALLQALQFRGEGAKG